MGNPLTSKERRGLTAVAAAALLCISSGFIVRSCSSSNVRNPQSQTIATGGNSVGDENKGKNLGVNKESSDSIKSKSKRKKKKKSGRKRIEKVYPERDPLSQPCD